MSGLILTSTAGALFGNEGKAYHFPPNYTAATDFRRIPPVGGVAPTSTRPSFAELNIEGKSRLYVVGGHTDNMFLDEHFRLLRQGIARPSARPTLAAAAGPGVTGSAIGYISFWDDLGKRRSPLSAGTAAVALVNQSRAWSALPTFAPDDEHTPSGTTTVNASATLIATDSDFQNNVFVGDQVAVSSNLTVWATVISVDSATQLTLNRTLGNGTTQTILLRRPSGITHVELWISMDGGLPRLVMRVDLGVAAVTENVATLALGEANTDDFEKFPRGKYNWVQYNRQWVAGDDKFPNRIYYSFINSLENMEGYLETRTGEPVKALFGTRDQLYVGCPGSIQAIQGFTSDDFVVSIVEPAIGPISHHAIKVIHGYAIVPTQLGIYLGHAGFTYISKHFEKLWRKSYRNNRAAFEDSWAVDHVDDNCYLLKAPVTDIFDDETGAVTFYWVLDYSSLIPQAGGTFVPPELLFDIYGGNHDSGFNFSIPGSSRSDVYIGNCSGALQIMHPIGDGSINDASDAYQKKWTVMPGMHLAQYGPGGDSTDGARWEGLWVYLTNLSTVWNLSVWTGDEYASEGVAEFAPASLPSSVETAGVDDLVKKTTHSFQPEIAAGRGLQIKVTAVTPDHGCVFKGYGGRHSVGTAYRGYIVSEGGS